MLDRKGCNQQSTFHCARKGCNQQSTFHCASLYSPRQGKSTNSSQRECIAFDSRGFVISLYCVLACLLSCLFLPALQSCGLRSIPFLGLLCLFLFFLSAFLAFFLPSSFKSCAFPPFLFRLFWLSAFLFDPFFLRLLRFSDSSAFSVYLFHFVPFSSFFLVFFVCSQLVLIPLQRRS